MSERINSLVVILEEDVGEERAENLRELLSNLTGVLRVEFGITTADTYVADMRVRTEMANKLLEIARNFLRGKEG